MNQVNLFQFNDRSFIDAIEVSWLVVRGRGKTYIYEGNLQFIVEGKFYRLGLLF